ncbi:AP2/B3-like transcriptional factor family protein [Euphorbia peplus]|nr:AP2/B3-like transcriptional factor family protein [Euphorbia peplus]
MAEDEECRSWEEDMYWNHFHCHQFSQILRPGFDRKLAIPEQFTKNLREKLPKSISLKGPSGSVWQATLTTLNHTVFVTQGWDEFANENLLEENDLLTFKYNGSSCFDVLIFDGRSMCEKAASYFVKKCGHKDQDSACQQKRKIGESSADDIYTTTPFVKPISSSRATTKKIRRPIQEIYASPNFPTEEINPHHVPEDFSASAEEIDTKADIEHISPTTIVHDVPYISSRRFITEEEKRNVVQLGQEVVTSNGFMIIMKPTHVSRRFYMSIPSSWMTKHGYAFEKQDVILRRGEDLWHTKYYYQKSKNNGGLSSGWKNFAVTNSLQEYDVCVFEPGEPTKDAIVLDVSIFRVHPEGL